MIPVPLASIELLNINDKTYGYKRLVSEQYSNINMSQNKQKIIKKAEKIYNIVTQENKSKMAKFYKELSCDFKLLEEKSKLYNSGKL